METLNNFSITSLSEDTFIGGTYREFTYDVFDPNGDPIDISSFTYTWILSPYGQPEIATLSKTGVFRSDYALNNRFTVYLYSDDTVNLSGKYTQQPVIVCTPGYEFRMTQGYVNIIPASTLTSITNGSSISQQVSAFTQSVSASLVGMSASIEDISYENLSVGLNTSTALTTTNFGYIRVPSYLNGWVLNDANACCSASSVSGSPAFTVARISASAADNTSASMLSSYICLAQGGWDSSLSGSPIVISTTGSSVKTGDRIKISTIAAGTGVAYTSVSLTFRKV